MALSEKAKQHRKEHQRLYDQRRRRLKTAERGGTLQERLEALERRLSTLCEWEWGYFAGLVDGEGTITMRLNGDPKGKNHLSWLSCNVSVCNTDKGMIDWLVTTFGGHHHWQPSWNGNKPVARWYLNGRQAALVCRHIYKYLKTYKRLRASIVVKMFDIPMSLQWTRGHTLPQHEIERRAVLWAEWQALPRG